MWVWIPRYAYKITEGLSLIHISYMQGGLTYEYGKYGVIKGIEEGLKE